MVEDSKGDPEGAVSAMRKVVQVDGVQIIMTIFTAVVIAPVALAQELKVPLFSPVEAPGLDAPSNIGLRGFRAAIRRCYCSGALEEHGHGAAVRLPAQHPDRA